MHKGDGALGDTRRAGKAGAVGEGDCDGSPFRGGRTPYPQKQSVWIEGRICRRAARPLAAVPGYQCCIRHRWFPTASDGGVGADTIRPLASACIRADALIATVSGVAGSLRRRGVTPPYGGIADLSNRSFDRAAGSLSLCLRRSQLPPGGSNRYSEICQTENRPLSGLSPVCTSPPARGLTADDGGGILEVRTTFRKGVRTWDRKK